MTENTRTLTSLHRPKPEKKRQCPYWMWKDRLIFWMKQVKQTNSLKRWCKDVWYDHQNEPKVSRPISFSWCGWFNKQSEPQAKTRGLLCTMRWKV